MFSVHQLFIYLSMHRWQWLTSTVKKIYIISDCASSPDCLAATAWWRQMEAFSAQLAICAGNSPVPGEFPAQRPVTRSFDVFFDLRLNKWLCKQSWGWWFETLSCPLWRHCNGVPLYDIRHPNWVVEKHILVNENELVLDIVFFFKFHQIIICKNSQHQVFYGLKT